MSNVTAKASKKKSFQHETSAYNPIVISNFTQQLNSLIVICKELKENQNKIIVNQQKIQTKLEILEEDKSSSRTLNESLKSELKNYHETITAKFDQCQHSTEKVHQYQTELSSFNEKIQSYAEVVLANIAQNNNTTEAINTINDNFENLKSNIETKIDQETESQLRQKKKLNVIIFNIPESTSSDLETQNKDDIKILQKVLNEKIVIKPNDLQNIYRKGNKSVNNKCRPIIMRFTNQEKRSEILGLRDLKYFFTDNSTTIKIYISPDRTIQQRDEHKKLVLQLKEKRAEGNKNLTIQNGRLVEYVQPFRKAPQKFWGDD